MSIKIYHNPKCSKSRQTLVLLQEKGVNPEIIEYLKTPPSFKELDTILKTLQKEPLEITRTKEERFKELGLKDKELDRNEMIQTLIDNPILIERPIVVNGNKAAIGRPPENVLEIL